MRLTMILLLCSAFGFAQSPAIKKIALQASEKNLKKNLYYLASDKLEGRLMGSHGDTLAAEMVAAAYKDQKLVAPYLDGRSYIQSITATRLDDKTWLTINGKTYNELDGWQLYPNLPVSLPNLPVIFAGYETFPAWKAAMNNIPLDGRAVILSDSLFKNYDTLDSLEAMLKTRGVKAIIWGSKKVAGVLERKKIYDAIPHFVESPAFNEPPSVLPEIGLTTERMRELLTADGITLSDDYIFKMPVNKPVYELKGAISIEKDRTLTPVYAPNVIGVLKGQDADAGVIILSAHHDHDGRVANKIHYGAVDNASGTVAIMEVARLMQLAVEQGYRPKHTIIFASYTGEERGLLGSYFFAKHPLYPLNKTFAVLNIDMLGRIDTLHANGKNPDSSYAYILVKDTLKRNLRTALYQANESVGLTLDTHYEQPKFEMRRIMGSDQFPFYEKGVPFVRIDCGFAKEYHKAGDTPDKIDYALLTRQTRLVFLTLWNMANN